MGDSGGKRGSKVKIIQDMCDEARTMVKSVYGEIEDFMI